MDGKIFAFDLQRFAKVTVTETTTDGTTTYTVVEKTITETQSGEIKTYQIKNDSTNTYNSLEEAVVAAANIKFTVTTTTTSDEGESATTTTTTYYDAAEDFKADNLTTTETGASITAINIYGDVTLQDDVDNLTGKITVKKTATLNTNSHTLKFGSDVKNGITIADSTDTDKITFTVNGGGKIIGTNDPIGDEDNILKAAKNARYSTTALISVGSDSSGGNAKGSTLTVKDVTIESNTGTICGTNNSVINIEGTSTVQSYMSCAIYLGNTGAGGQKLTVKDTATIATGVKFTEENTDDTKETDCGTLTKKKNSNLPAIQVAGNYGSDETQITIDIQDNAKIEFNNKEDDLLTSNKTDDDKEYIGNTTAIYIGGNAKLTVKGSASVTSGGTGIEMRAGELEIPSDSSVKVESTAQTYAIRPNGSGSTTFGAAIAISQHTTAQAIKTNVGSGDFSAPIALAVENPQNNASTEEKQIAASLTGGTFKSTSSQNAIAAKSTDSRVTVEISNVTFEGILESTSDNKDDQDLAFDITGEVTIITTDEEGNQTTVTYDADTKTLKYNKGTDKYNPEYVTVQEG